MSDWDTTMDLDEDEDTGPAEVPPNPDYERLRAPADPEHIQWRVLRTGMSGHGKPWAQIIAYIDSRTLMDRLDEAAPGWTCDITIQHLQTTGGETASVACCAIGLRGYIKRVGHARENGWHEEMDKSAETLAFRRAAVMFDICACRSLYRLPTTFAEIVDAADVPYERRFREDGHQYGWRPPALEIDEGAYVVAGTANNRPPKPAPKPKQDTQPISHEEPWPDEEPEGEWPNDGIGMDEEEPSQRGPSEDEMRAALDRIHAKGGRAVVPQQRQRTNNGSLEDDPLWLRECRFAKHKGKTWKQVYHEDPKYLQWMINPDTEVPVILDWRKDNAAVVDLLRKVFG